MRLLVCKNRENFNFEIAEKKNHFCLFLRGGPQSQLSLKDAASSKAEIKIFKITSPLQSEMNQDLK